MKIVVIVCAILISGTACIKSEPTPVPAKTDFTQTSVPLATHKLAAFSIIKNSDYLIVFESGLTNDHTVWNSHDIAVEISDSMDVVAYDRAGYGKSEGGPVPRNINRLQSELNAVVDAFAKGRKVILVGHSLGGLIIRDWAIKNPTRVAALLFIDPAHEAYNQISQAEEDALYITSVSYYGTYFGGTLEAREFREDIEYMATLGNLPDVPVTVLTSTKTDAAHTAEDRQAWYNAHDLLRNGVTDFTHINCPDAGHYIMVDEPDTVTDNIQALIAKLP